ncbi:MAG: N-acetyl-gamma-glutamyl-phosphate reductase [Treponema sp.]|jgi:N-acetyl-gamma-glutamyl-phosphate reductase|nr:N-acetyl-gamma-glutamyl-phosphate reductase [Treponema sp.]
MKAGVIGATGYVGAELVRLLVGHPNIDGLELSSVSYEGGHIEDMYLNFFKKVSIELKKAEAVIETADVIFSSLPHGVGEAFAKACVEHGKPFIDLSADFRFGSDEETFSAWYGKSYQYPELRGLSVYGLPELNRQVLKAKNRKVIVGNPGCYPTAATLGAMPALAKNLAGTGTIIVDAASGVTGGGRELTRAYHFPECAEAMSPYKIGCHRHTPEIARNFAIAVGRAVPLIFTPHLAPMNRGILATIYIPLAGVQPVSKPHRPPSKEVVDKTAEIHALYATFYKNEPFIRVLPLGSIAVTNRVKQSNFCDISIHIDQTGSTLIVISAIDNMVKGAAGQAIQNMNIICGFAEDAGLSAVPALF